jgi:hypothetical protein
VVQLISEWGDFKSEIEKHPMEQKLIELQVLKDALMSAPMA